MKSKPVLTPRDNFLRAARRQNPKWVPMDFGGSRRVEEIWREHAGANVDFCEYFRFDGRWMGPGPTRKSTPDWRMLYYADGSLPKEAEIEAEWGCGFVDDPATDDRQMYFPLRNIQTAAEVDAFPWPDAGAAYRYDGKAAKVRETQANGYAVHFGGAVIFESVWNLRGFEQLMMDMAEGAPVAKRLFERMYETNVRLLEQGARTGADVLTMGGDVATQRGPLMSRKTWREYIFPVMRDAIRAAKKANPNVLIDYHSCGNVTQLIDDFIEAGIDILNPVQPECMDIFELKRCYGKQVAFHGGIGVQSVLPHGTPQQVKDMVRKTIDVMAEGGGYICTSSHSIGHDVPWENVMAMVEAVREYGHP